MADLTLKTEPLKDLKKAVKVNLAGAIDASTVITFQQNLEKLKNDEGIRTFLLDMEGIRYVNSTGLGSLVKLADGLEKEGGVITLMRIHPKVKVVFDMLGLNAFFKIFDKETDAVAFLKGGGKGEGIAEPEAIEELAPVAPPHPKPAHPPEAKPARPKTAPALKPVVTPLRTPTPAPAPPPPPAPAPSAAPAHAAAPLAAIDLSCAMCGLSLQVSAAGDYRCPRCFHVFKRTSAGAIENTGRRKPIPVQLTLTGQDFCIEGFKRFVEVMAEDKGFKEDDIAGLREAITETCRNIVDLAYDKNLNLSFQVLLSGEKGEPTIRLADHGKAFDPNGDRFAATRRAVTEFIHERHPNGGNILRLTKKA